MRSQAQKRLDKWTYRKCCEVLYVSAERDKKPKERRIKTKEEFRMELERCRNEKCRVH